MLHAIAPLLLVLFAAACRNTEPAPEASEPTPEPPGVVQEPTPPPADEGLKDAQAWMRTDIEKRGDLDVRFDGEPVDLASPVAIDFEYGAGHGGNLVLMRMCVEGGTTRCERLTYQGKSVAQPKTLGGTASRAEVPTATVMSLLDMVRALSTASVSARPRDRLWNSSGDFFALVRICGPDAGVDRTWEFGGYPSSREEFRYAAIDAVLDRAREMFETLRWTPVPVEDFRSTHFSDAFARNRAWYGADPHWWVLDRSLDAVEWFGNRNALTTLAWIRDHGWDVGHGRALHARWVLDEPSKYLEGPPPEVQEQ